MNTLTPPVRMNFSGGAIAQNWSRWEREFRTFFAACELGQKPNETQVAILLHSAGPEAKEINQTLVYANDDERKDYNVVLAKLRAYCEPRKNVVFERHRFWSRDQMDNETIGQWTTELRTRAAKVRVPGVRQHDKRQDCIRNTRQTGTGETPTRVRSNVRERALDICRASETRKVQYQAMSSLHQQDIAVHDIRAGEKRGQKQGQSQNSRSQRQCKYCGSTHPPRQCPAYNKKCNKCGCLNHFAAVCKGGGSKLKHSKPVHTLLNVETEDSANENSLFVGQLFVGDIQNTDWRAELRVCDVPVTFKLDTGAQANVLPVSYMRALCHKHDW